MNLVLVPLSNQGESGVGSTDGFERKQDREMQTYTDQCETVDYIP